MTNRPFRNQLLTCGTLALAMGLGACGNGVIGPESNIDSALTSNGFRTVATAALATAAPGSSVTATASVTAIRKSNVLVDVEIYAPNGTMVAQSYWDNQAFTASSTHPFAITWAIP